MGRFSIIGNTGRAICILLLCTILFSCEKDGKEVSDTTGGNRVLLYYAAGYNNLSDAIKEDIGQLSGKGFIPYQNSDAIMLIFSNLVNGGYSNPSSPVLERVYRNNAGGIVHETVMTWEDGTIAASANTLNEVMQYVKNTYPGKEYGMIFSSHATGWIPAKNKEAVSPNSIGNEYGPDRNTYEMDLTDFAEAIPMKLDFILFDACFMGCVEVAYELRDKCRYMAFSQTEVLADGFDYTTMAEYLLKYDKADLEGVCKAYFNHYNSLSGQYRSATVSLIDCSRMDPLATECREIFSAHRDELDNIDPDEVQCFGRIRDHEYFYDLGDIVNHLSVSKQETDDFNTALNYCIMYKAATEIFINIDIKEFCGLSSYIPNKGTYDKFYKTLSWNEDTGMIQ